MILSLNLHLPNSSDQEVHEALRVVAQVAVAAAREGRRGRGVVASSEGAGDFDLPSDSDEKSLRAESGLEEDDFVDVDERGSVHPAETGMKARSLALQQVARAMTWAVEILGVDMATVAFVVPLQLLQQNAASLGMDEGAEGGGGSTSASSSAPPPQPMPAPAHPWSHLAEPGVLGYVYDAGRSLCRIHVEMTRAECG